MQLPVLNNLLTHSQMTAYKTCPRKTYFAYEIGVRPAMDAKPLRFGSAVHLGLDLYAKGDDAWIEKAIAGYVILPEWARTDDLMHAWAIERVTVRELLIGYHHYWHNLGYDGCVVVESEKTFRVPIINPETGRPTPAFNLGGKRDKIMREPSGRLKLREHKTTSEDLSPESDYWKRWRIDQQVSGYYLACRAEGIAIETVEIDAIRKPSIGPLSIPITDAEGVKIVLDASGQRVRTKDGKKWRESGNAELGYVLQSRVQTPEEFAERLAQDIAERPEWYFQRREIPRLEADLAEFRDELWQIQQQYGDSRRRGRWFRNTAACRSFGSACAYFDICTNGIPVIPESPPQGFVKVYDLHPELSA